MSQLGTPLTAFCLLGLHQLWGNGPVGGLYLTMDLFFHMSPSLLLVGIMLYVAMGQKFTAGPPFSKLRPPRCNPVHAASVGSSQPRAHVTWQC